MSRKSPSDIFGIIEKLPKPIAPKSSLEIKLVTGLSAVNIMAEPGAALAVARGVQSHSPAASRDTTLDTFFDCEGYDIGGNARRGVGIATAIAYGSLSWKYRVDATAVSIAYAYGGYIEGSVYDGIADVLAKAFGDLLLENIRRNWIKWSNIGSADFTIWKDNVAGERPLDWKGSVYAIKKLLNKMVVYGENGVSYFLPIEKYFDLLTIYRLGLKGKSAVAGDEKTHYFVDTAGQLWILGETLELLDYSEYLADLGSNTVLSWDVKNSLLYICDGTSGYVYSPRSSSLGKGPVSITGIGSQDGLMCVVAPATIVTPVFEICTDIYDMGTRKNKTIFEIEIGTNIIGTLQVSIDYRNDFRAAFSQTDWKDVSKRGNCFLTALGREFRIRAKIENYEYFEVDYIIAKGIVHAH